MTTNPQTIIRPSPKISFLNAREICGIASCFICLLRGLAPDGVRFVDIALDAMTGISRV